MCTFKADNAAWHNSARLNGFISDQYKIWKTGKEEVKTMKELNLEELAQVNGGIDETTESVLELIGKIVHWFEDL